MFELSVPGYRTLRLEHIVLDYNGTMAVDGVLVPGVCDRLNVLADQFTIHILTADTFGKVREQSSEIRCEVTILPPGDQDIAKRDYVLELGSSNVAAIGNGRNDRLMLEQAGLGIAVLMDEGTALPTLSSADILVPHINAALDLFAEPNRLVATLRS